MKVILPKVLEDVNDEFTLMKTTLIIDEFEFKFSRQLEKEVKFNEAVITKILEIIKDGNEPFVVYEDGDFVVREI